MIDSCKKTLFLTNTQFCFILRNLIATHFPTNHDMSVTRRHSTFLDVFIRITFDVQRLRNPATICIIQIIWHQSNPILHLLTCSSFHSNFTQLSLQGLFHELNLVHFKDVQGNLPTHSLLICYTWRFVAWAYLNMEWPFDIPFCPIPNTAPCWPCPALHCHEKLNATPPFCLSQGRRRIRQATMATTQ